MQTMVYSQMYPGDVNFLDSVETYLKKIGVPADITPQERLIVEEQARTSLYSFDVQCIPRIANKIISADMESDQEARALWIAFSHHVMDPVFVQFLMQYLATRHDAAINGQVGALLSKVLDQFFNEHFDPKESKKDDKKKEELPEFEEVKHLQIAMETLLAKTASEVQVNCIGLTHPEALFVAACLNMNSKETIKELLKSDLGVTADLFDLMGDPDNFVRGSLKLLKSEVPSKPSKNQTAFLESLKRWIFTKLDGLPQVTCYQYLVGEYGGVKPDVSPYYIQIKDCGTTFSNLIQVAKQIVNK